MRLFIREFYDLVLDGRAISWSDTLNSTCVKWRSVQITADDIMRLLRRVSNPAGQLFHVELAIADVIQRKNLGAGGADFLWGECKHRRRIVPELGGASRKADRSRI